MPRVVQPVVLSAFKPRELSADDLQYNGRRVVRGRRAAGARRGHYLAFFPSYSYLQQVREDFTARYPDMPILSQESAMDEAQRAAFLERFRKQDEEALLGFAVLGGVFGEGVDLTGESLIGAAIVSPGLPQIGPRQEQLRDYFEKTRGTGFDYAYRYPGMNKVLQAAGRVIRTPQDRGVVLLIDDRFAAPDTRRLMPPHWEHLRVVESAETLTAELERFWGREASPEGKAVSGPAR